MDPNAPVLPSRDLISLVTLNCGCDEDRATDLLKRSKNDPKRAIKLHSLMSKYSGKVSPRSSRPMTPGTPRSDDGHPNSLNRPFDQDDELFLTSQRGTQRFPESDVSTLYIDRESESPHHLHPGHRHEQRHAVELDSGSSDLPHAGSAEQYKTDASGTAETYVTASNAFKSAATYVDTDGPELEGHYGYENKDSESEGQNEWDFVLPVIPLPPGGIGLSVDGYESSNLRDLIAIMQNGGSHRTIQEYLGRFDENTIRKSINHDIEGFPSMFYVVETNKEDILRTWVAYGGDTCAIHKPSKVPLLAFAIMHSENLRADTTLMTATLLSLGASPDVIPSAFYSPYLQDLPDYGPKDEDLRDLDDEHKSWCKDAARVKLARTSTLSQRYYLERAAKTKKPSRRQTQVAQRMKAEPLLGIANFLIGQTTAAKSLLATLLAHITEPGKKPLVLVFAGPSGHGKTELARRLGHVLSLDLEVVDCTIFNREMELFGPRHPYVGAERGTPLNNFLAKNHEQRCIVFLDEFEKTSPDIHKTLLLPFDNGEYQDRRNLDKINCSKTIWILATNAHDGVIQDFATANKNALFSDADEAESKSLLKQLSHRIRGDFQAHHGPPITGRISDFLPFLPFSVGEQAVIVHKVLLELGRKVQRPVNLSDGPDEQLLGNIRLRIRRDASVCQALAEVEYHSDLGARSLIAAGEKIKRLLVEEYLSIDEDIEEGGGLNECVIDVSGGEVVVRMVPAGGKGR